MESYSTNPFIEDLAITKIDLEESLQKLFPLEQEIILLSNQGYTIREIAEKIYLPSTTVFRIKETALNELKRMMDGEDNPGELWK